MLDWIKCKLPITHTPIESGAFIVVAPDGSIEREIVKSLIVPGSYSSNITVRSVGAGVGREAEYLEISGNPAKFLQGHNVFGSDNLIDLVYGTAELLCAYLDIPLDTKARNFLLVGNYYVNWVDVNYSYELDCQSDVQAWIRQAEFNARTRCGRPVLKGSTLYFQKNSRRWAIKAYSKWCELNSSKKHRLPSELQDSGLLEWSEKVLRIELRLLGKELRDIGINKACQLTEEKLRQLHGDYMKKIIIKGQLKLPSNDLLNLPSTVRSTYTLWLDGHLLKDILTPRTFYRHRKILLEHDIDISIPETNSKSNVIPLIRILEAKPIEIPEWAYEKGLVYGSVAREVSNG